ncbi:type 2 isopentenyl-diphosphate Delta-isomerase [bacterium]|nr:type 2 isopentenyl-diphosphate Delta-isomerase [bacterium]
MDLKLFEARKRDHLRIALEPAHQAQGLNGLDRVHLHHEALPEIDFEEVQISSLRLKATASTPFYVAGMTAGHSDAVELNQLLAVGCEKRGWAMGVGSQRRELESNSSDNSSPLSSPNSSIDEWRRLREKAPKLQLFANIGISQLGSAKVSQLRKLVDSIGAQALVVHANALQESLQPEGTPRFKGALQNLQTVCKEIGVPVILKETGCGFSIPTLKKVSELALSAVDVSGLGGTHWGRIEGARAEASQATLQAEAAKTFANWGESTADSVLSAKKTLRPSTEIWASGGVRTGLDAAKLIALGAQQIGYARPALEAALKGPEALDAWMALQEFELKVALFCTGCKNPEALRTKEGIWQIREI